MAQVARANRLFDRAAGAGPGHTHILALEAVIVQADEFVQINLELLPDRLLQAEQTCLFVGVGAAIQGEAQVWQAQSLGAAEGVGELVLIDVVDQVPQQVILNGGLVGAGGAGAWA